MRKMFVKFVKGVFLFKEAVFVGRGGEKDV